MADKLTIGVPLQVLFDNSDLRDNICQSIADQPNLCGLL